MFHPASEYLHYFTISHSGLDDIYMGTVSDHRKLLETSLFGWELAEAAKAARPVPLEFERWFVPSSRLGKFGVLKSRDVWDYR